LVHLRIKRVTGNTQNAIDESDNDVEYVTCLVPMYMRTMADTANSAETLQTIANGKTSSESDTVEQDEPVRKTIGVNGRG